MKTLLLLAVAAFAAAIPYEFAMDKSAGFIMDPNQHKAIGQLLSFSLGSTTFKPDLTIALPVPASQTSILSPGLQTVVKTGPTKALTANVAGVLEKFSWNGGVGDAIKVDAWVSQENAFALKAMQQSTLKSTKVDFNLAIEDYDQETKQWYTKFKTPAALHGQLAAADLNVDLKGAPAKDGISVMVYKISFSITPLANTTTALTLANSSTKSTVKSWGLVVGTLSGASVKTAP